MKHESGMGFGSSDATHMQGGGSWAEWRGVRPQQKRRCLLQIALPVPASPLLKRLEAERCTLP